MEAFQFLIEDKIVEALTNLMKKESFQFLIEDKIGNFMANINVREIYFVSIPYGG